MSTVSTVSGYGFFRYEGGDDFSSPAQTAAAAVDEEGRIAAWSPGAQLLLGYAPQEVVGREVTALLADVPPDLAPYSLARRQVWAGRVTLRDRAGRLVQADLRACPLLDADGHTQWFVQALVPPESGNTVALALQHSLLQHPVPVQQAVETAVRYLPADPQAGVGGDWFDVIPLSGARVALVVGDVVGHGVHASAAMGRLRTAVRTLADVDLPPDELLAALDHLILDEWRDGLESGEIGATCLYAVYDPVTCRCSAASAGHPAPALVTPDGTTVFVDVEPGPPLGVGGVPFEAVDFPVTEGSLLVLYTDGLVEARDHDIRTGLDTLRRALARPGSSLESLCDGILRTLLPGPPGDDVALLTARTHALDASHVASWEIPPDPAAVADARRRATAQLTLWGLREAALSTTELIVSELVTNAIRHAHAPIGLRLIHDGTLICEVSDSSSTSPHPRRAHAFDEGGRGLFLVGTLCERWGTRHTPHGKTIWTEQPLAPHDTERVSFAVDA